MSGHDELLDEVLRTHEAVSDAEAAVEHRVVERENAVQKALSAGVGAQQLADALHVSRPRVYQLAKRRKR